MAEPSREQIDDFIARWEKSGGHERGAGQQFLLEFCDLLGLDKPDPPAPENELNTYTFERRVDRTKPDGSSAPNWIDLFKGLRFVLETKQGVNPRRDKSDPDQPLLPALDAPSTKSLGHGRRGSSAWDKALDRAHAQGERYIHLLPPGEPRPPFLIVCDVGHCFDLYAEFTGTGAQYEAFPDPRRRRVLLRDLHDPEVRERFRKIWSDPHSLDPSKHAAAVTREVAKALADLARSLEKDGHDPQHTAGFLQRCLFTMFAEDVGLLPKDSFLGLLQRVKDKPEGLVTMLRALWKDMATGAEFSVAIQEKIPHFNGGLFKDTSVLPLRPEQILYLIHAAKQDWSAVEPAIFGTLLERALDPRERHKLGAHYTPRSYVERLVRPTLVEPLRAEWEAVKAAAAQLDEQGKTQKARHEVETFHRKLAATRVLDPACGSGNFLYVSLELLKRLEAEVLDLFEKLGGDRALEMDTVLIRPTNFLGIEINPRAAAIAQLVLWIGYFQWHRKTTGKADTNDRPLLPKDNTIECRDAVLDFDQKIPRTDPETGEPLTIWDGRTTKPHPVTGNEVPDESARMPLFDFMNPTDPEWPAADYVVGNPPFIGVRKIIGALGEGYVSALRQAHHDVPETTDFVGYWWHKAACLLRQKKIEQFGFITTNSITQDYSRRVIEQHLDRKPRISFRLAIPDHPWVDTVEGAAVRVAMHVVGLGSEAGVLSTISDEVPDLAESGTSIVKFRDTIGVISGRLKVTKGDCKPQALQSNGSMCFQGVVPAGDGFKLTSHSALTRNKINCTPAGPIRSYLIGKDLVQHQEDRRIIDCYGLSVSDVEARFPDVFQHLLVTVKPERDHNRRQSYREKWWMFAEPRPALRHALQNLKRYIGTPYTAKYRPFVFIDSSAIPDAMVYAVATDDAALLGVLSSSIHGFWAKYSGGTLEDRPRYNSNGTFLPFPFPALEEGPLKQRIRELGEKLDAHRKERQAAHPGLTLTGMYNVLEKLRRGEPLGDKDKTIHDQGLVTILKQLHDDLDAAVLEAYGWDDLKRGTGVPPVNANGPPAQPASPVSNAPPPAPLADRLAAKDDAAQALEQQLLTRLVALNHERAEEEKRGLVRWLRPEYQAPDETGVPAAEQQQIELEAEQAKDTAALVPAKLKWPKELSGQVSAIQKLLPATGPDPAAIAGHFGKRTKARIAHIDQILQTLTALGKL